MSKLLYLVLFYLIYGVTDVALIIIAIVQTCLNLFTGEPSESLKDFGKSLAIYVKQITEYLSYASELKPFPFSDWPTVEVAEEDLQELKH